MPGSALAGMVSADESPDRLLEGLEEKGYEPYRAEAGDAVLLSTREPVSDGRVLVAFNGYLEGTGDRRPEERIRELYSDHGVEFIERVRGAYRLAVYDRDRERIHLFTDRAGDRPVHYTTAGEGFSFASHISPLLALRRVGGIDTAAVHRYIRSWPVAYSNPETVVDGVRRMDPSQRLSAAGGTVQTETYWTPFTDRDTDISDTAAVDRIDAALNAAIDRALEQGDGPPNVMFSGGLDSSLVAAMLAQKADTVNTFSHGYQDRTLQRAREHADRIGTDHHAVQWEKRFPTAEEIWQLEVPGPLAPFYNTYRDVDAFETDAYFTGLSATVPFPVGLDKIRTIDRIRSLPVGRNLLARGVSAVGKMLHRTGIAGPGTCNNLLNGADLLASPYRSAAVTRPMAVNQRLFGREEDYSLERRLEQRQEMTAKRLDDAVVQLELRERVQRWSAAHTNRIRHYNIFCHPRLLELTYSLPMSQVQDRRLERMLARRYLPDDLASLEPGGLGEVADSYRELIERNRGSFRQRLRRFRERDLIDGGYSDLGDGGFPEHVFHRVNMYVMETWLETFADRDEPWTRPSEG